MNDQAARILASLVERYGTSLAYDPLRCEGLLRDTCPRCSREIFVLVNAVRQQVPADLLSPRHSLPPALFRGFLVKRLQDEFAFSDEAAHWAVESWAGALGIGTGKEMPVPGIPPPAAGGRTPGIAFPDDRSSGDETGQRAERAKELESGSVESRLGIVRRLARSPDAGNLRLLITCLENPSWRVREAAFETLAEAGEPAVPCLIEALEDSHEQVVVPAIIALGTIRARRAVDPLAALLEGGGGPAAYAAWALGEIGDERAITPLTRLLKSSDPRMQSAAEEALRKFGPAS